MNVFISGGSRGVGLGMVQRFLELTSARVIATARNPHECEDLLSLVKKYGDDRLILISLDMTSQDSIDSMMKTLNKENIKSIDVLIENAAIFGPNTSQNDSILNCDPKEIIKVFETNVVGNLRLLQAFHDLLLESKIKLVMIMTSTAGSLDYAAKARGPVVGGMVPYRCSKVALNMLGVLYSLEPSVKDSGCKVILFYPGYVDTEIGRMMIDQPKKSVESATGDAMDILKALIEMQIQKNPDSNPVVFLSPPDVSPKHYLHELITYLEFNNIAFLKYDGTLIPW